MNVFKENFELNQHRTMCLIGGFIGAYSLLICNNNFGSAQTVNMISLVMNLLGGDLPSFFLRVVGLALYFIAIECTVWINKKTSFHPKRYALLVESICLVLIGCMSQDVNPIVHLYPAFFMMSTQWSIFHGACGFNSSTIFSTNNFKQFSLALGNYVIEKDAASLKKMKLFANSLLFFHTGVAISFFACKGFHNAAIWLCALPLAFAFRLVQKEDAALKKQMDCPVSMPAIKQAG